MTRNTCKCVGCARPLTAVTRVQIPYALPRESPARAGLSSLVCSYRRTRAWPCEAGAAAECAALYAERRIDPSPIFTHVLPLSETPVGYRLMAERAEGAIKVGLRPA